MISFRPTKNGKEKLYYLTCNKCFAHLGNWKDQQEYRSIPHLLGSAAMKGWVQIRNRAIHEHLCPRCAATDPRVNR